MAKILVVDDDPAVRHSLKRALRREGNKVLSASDGLEALVILNDESIDVALVDIVMPTIDGLTLMRRILQDHPRVRIVTMSAFDDVIDLPARELGLILSLKKPFTLDEAKVALGLALRRTGEEQSS